MTENAPEFKREPLGSGYFAITANEYTFSSDAIILADFSRLMGEKKICDLCAGCGIISLLWCAAGKRCEIDAVEIQKDAADLIVKAADENGLSNINVINADLRKLGSQYNGKYDLVAVNPPYKKEGTGKMSLISSALAARHEQFCTLEDAVSVSSKMLKNGGRLCLCQRPERLCDILTLMRKHKVEPKRVRFVQQKVSTKPWLVLAEGKKSAKPGLIAEPALIVEGENGGYSDEMNSIYHKFD